MDAEIVSFLTNQGLAIGIATFLVWWVTTQMGAQIKATCEGQARLCEQQIKLATAMDRMVERLEAHDARAKDILEKVVTIEKKID
ncbi:hypothetical protein [Mitsuokella multacida]|uniref:hypothetical protein n=1 Tax=Mitsuokella multacida TaxID=52226 RepID=UPI003FA282B2